MPIIETSKPGSFCWMELGTSDQDAAKTFYEGLLGWTHTDHPMGPAGVYTMFHLQGRDAAAGYALNPEMKSMGIPPHWMLYISVANADEAAKKIESAGGSVKRGPFDVMDAGRMAICQDPTGAMFAIWQPMRNPGIGIINEPGAFCWADQLSPDPETASKFYTSAFGWEFEAGHDGSGYLHIKNGGDYIGGMPPAKYFQHGMHPHWQLYFAVSEIQASTEKAKTSGAKVLLGPTEIPGAGKMTVVADPQGAVFTLFEQGRR